MISNFFVLSPRGDTILFKQYRSNSHTSSTTESSSSSNTATAHERSNTEAFFRKIKFWDDTSMMNFSSMNALDSYMTQQQQQQQLASTNHNNKGSNGNSHSISDPNDPSTTDGTTTTSSSSTSSLRTGDAPPVFPMPDGHTYLHIKRNGLIFAASTIRNVSPNTVLEVRLSFSFFGGNFGRFGGDVDGNSNRLSYFT